MSVPAHLSRALRRRAFLGLQQPQQQQPLRQFSASAVASSRAGTYQAHTLDTLEIVFPFPNNAQILTTTTPDALVTFHESSSPELASLLSSLRSRVVLPRLLNAEQRHAVFSAKHRSRLQHEDFVVALGPPGREQDVRLEPLRAAVDVPPRWASLRAALRLARTDDDWANVFLCAEALEAAGVPLRLYQREVLLRKACEAGRVGLAVGAFRRVGRSGFSLREAPLRAYVFAMVRRHAEAAGWEEEDTRRALGWCEALAEMLEDERHCGGSTSVGLRDPRAEPAVIAPLVELAGVRAERHLGGKDQEGKVATYALRLVHAMKQREKAEIELLPTLKKDPEVSRTASMFERSWYLAQGLPLWHALDLSLRILGDDMPMRKDAVRWKDEVHKLLAEVREGITVYEGSELPGVNSWDALNI
ncbi:hypothetical protein BDY21DRAFT_66045 [Lineolata rhizophorae]|uniref:Uncharacterized protein n=1 Tax=Lineolata rhizophorae TaxID=578093 RepID=A0A6A6NUQ5_9PEZI|nr:hypothetical protein BDY21DRAFT_66045 [Lineolata rhizophorae]